MHGNSDLFIYVMPPLPPHKRIHQERRIMFETRYNNHMLWGNARYPSAYKYAQLPSLDKLTLSNVLQGHGGCVNTVEFNEAGTILCTGSDDTHLCFFDACNNYNRVAKVPTAHWRNIFSASFLAHHPEKVLSCGLDAAVVLTNVETSSSVVVMSSGTHMMTSTLSKSSWPSGHLSALFGGGPTVMVFDMATSKPHSIFQLDGAVTSLVAHPINPFLIAIGTERAAYVSDLRKAEVKTANSMNNSPSCVFEVAVPQTRRSVVREGLGGLAFDSLCGSFLALNFRNDDVYIYDLRGATRSINSSISCPRVRLTGRDNSQTMFKEVAFCFDNKYLATGCDSGNIVFWDVERITIGDTLSGEDHVECCYKIRGDSDIVNGVLCHVAHPTTLVACGIDPTTKVFQVDFARQQMDKLRLEAQHSSGKSAVSTDWSPQFRRSQQQQNESEDDSSDEGEEDETLFTKLQDLFFATIDIVQRYDRTACLSRSERFCRCWAVAKEACTLDECGSDVSSISFDPSEEQNWGDDLEFAVDDGAEPGQPIWPVSCPLIVEDEELDAAHFFSTASHQDTNSTLPAASSQEPQLAGSSEEWESAESNDEDEAVVEEEDGELSLDEQCQRTIELSQRLLLLVKAAIRALQRRTNDAVLFSWSEFRAGCLQQRALLRITQEIRLLCSIHASFCHLALSSRCNALWSGATDQILQQKKDMALGMAATAFFKMILSAGLNRRRIAITHLRRCNMVRSIGGDQPIVVLAIACRYHFLCRSMQPAMQITYLLLTLLRRGLNIVRLRRAVQLMLTEWVAELPNQS